jgi:hypothetical protein
MFLFTNNNKIKNNLNNNIFSSLTKNIKFPIWHKSHIKCNNDDDCPIPYACCHDPLFPLENKYCCKNYKSRIYKYAYIMNYIK